MDGGVWGDGPVLLGRDEQLTALAEVIDGAAGGEGGGVLLEGPAGIGKTSLLRAAARRGEDTGLRVLEARGDELEAGLPWGLAVQLFERPSADESAFAGAAGLARAIFDPPAGPASGPPDPFPILHGLHWLTANLAEAAPLLLLLDDAHWADPQSLRFVAYLLGRIDSMPVALVLATRSGERGNEELLSHLRGEAAVRTSTLPPLESDSIEALVGARLPAADGVFRAAVAKRVAGNPFLCEELLREAIAEGIEADSAGVARLGELQPEGIGRAIAARLAHLGPDAERLAAAVAVLGMGATLDLARHLVGLEEAPAVAAADALLLADVLALEPTLRFVHPVIGEAVEAELGEAKRSALHRQAARLLHQRGHGAEAVATHLLLAGEIDGDPWAVPTLRQAAGEAMARGAPERAAELLDRALAEPTSQGDPGLLLSAGQAAMALAKPRATELLESSLHAAQAPLERSAALASLAQISYVSGDTSGAVALARATLELIPPGQGGPLEAEVLANFAAAARANPDFLIDFAQILELPRTGPAGEPTGAEFVRLAFRALDLSMRGDRRAATAQAEAALSQERSEPATLPVLARGLLGFALANLGRHDDEEKIAEQILGEARSAGNLVYIGMGLEARAHARWARGDVVSGLADSEVVMQHGEGRWDLAMIPGRVFRSLVLLESGEDAEAAAAIKVPTEIGPERLHGSWAWLWLPYGRAQLAYSSGDFEAAVTEAKLVGERTAACEIVNLEHLLWRPLAARALSRIGQQEEALALAREDLELSESCCSPRAAAIARATLGAIEAGQTGVERLESAIGDLDNAGAELEAARARFDLGVLLRRLRRPRDARVPLAEAIDIAARLGARRIAANADGELRAAGGRPRRQALRGVGSLTPGQRRVAEMAAQGLSNPEVAQALFLSVRTVESHLRATYSKLEIDSREQLAEALSAAAG